MPIISIEREVDAGTRKSRSKLSQYPYLYIAPTPSCGFGLFTVMPSKAGAVVLRVHDPHYLSAARSYAQLRTIGYTYADLFQVGDDLFIPPYGGLDDFTNHSCEPNCGLRVDHSGFEMIALTDIAAHEELTYDYSTHQEHPRDFMICQCRTASCRGVIGSFSDLPAQLRRRYLQLGMVAAFAAVDLSRAAAG